MPLYEFECLQCGMCFEALVALGTENDVRCEGCGGSQIRKRVSRFGIGGGSSHRSSSGSGDCATCSANSCATCR